MKTTMKEFFDKNKNCKKLKGKAETILIFDHLSKDDSIIKMINACNFGKPALTPVAKEIEDLLNSIVNPSISLDDNFTKQAVGLMVKSILEPFGYTVCGQKKLPNGTGAEKFVSASCYKLDPKVQRTMEVVNTIVEITPSSKK